MKNKLSRRTFIASAAVSIVPSAIAHARPAVGGVFSLFAAEPRLALAPNPTWQGAGVIDLSLSPFAKL